MRARVMACVSDLPFHSGHQVQKGGRSGGLELAFAYVANVTAVSTYRYDLQIFTMIKVKRVCINQGSNLVACLTVLQKVRKSFYTLGADMNGVSAVEFALVTPLFMALGMYGAEIAWMNAAAMEVSQVALALADNASRMGQADNSGVTPTVTAGDVASVLYGALEEGEGVNLADNGRVILSSLEMHPVTGRQYIHWQQCSGKGSQQSKYGKPDLTGSLLTTITTGVKINGRNITAPSRSAVMMAEVWFTYTPLFGSLFMKPITMHEQAAIIVRDDRNVGAGISGLNSKIKC